MIGIFKRGWIIGALALGVAAMLVTCIWAKTGDKRSAKSYLAALSGLLSSGGQRAGGDTAPVASGGGEQASAPVPPTLIGINPIAVLWYANQRAFANLMLGGEWQFSTPTGWSSVDPAFVGPHGELLGVPPGGDVVRLLTRPDTGPGGKVIRCTYQGKGDVTVHGHATEVQRRSGEVRFRWTNNWQNDNVWMQVHAVDRGAPLHAIDCRDDAMPRSLRFAPAFIAGLRGYKIIRFMDWQRTNANAATTLAGRRTPATTDVAGGDGVAIEDMIELCREVGADPWVTIPWNAETAYTRFMARQFHDGLPGRRVYVELGNEVWNLSFPAAKQALAEGQQRGLATNSREAELFRYAERTIEMMPLWEQAFADDPRRLVRIVATQHVVPQAADMVLGYPHLASHVDALATAPYFGLDVMGGGETTDLDTIFSRLTAAAEKTIQLAEANRRIALRYNKRYLAYEAGQHVVLYGKLTLQQAIQRDPRMYAVYSRYLEGWQRRVGDALMLFNSTGLIQDRSAFGLAEHDGQALADAPKLRAVVEARDRLAGR